MRRATSHPRTQTLRVTRAPGPDPRPSWCSVMCGCRRIMPCVQVHCVEIHPLRGRFSRNATFLRTFGQNGENRRPRPLWGRYVRGFARQPWFFKNPSDPKNRVKGWCHFLTLLVKTDETAPVATKSSLRERWSRTRRVTFGKSVTFDDSVNFDTFGG